jgi:hypothetical protein
MRGGRSSAGRASAALAWLLAGPLTAHAVPVTWEAQGFVEYSDLDAEFFATYMPGLAGTQAHHPLILRITFDPGAPLIRQTTFPNGGRSFSFDGSSLVLALEVPGRGMHMFSIDGTIPPGTVPSFVAVVDDLVTGVPEYPVIDGLEFSHAYLTPEGAIDFTILASFFTTDTTMIDGASLPLAPDPRLADGVEWQISIVDPSGGDLFGIFSSLVRIPTDLLEPGTLALASLGMLALGALQLQRRRTAT